MTRKDEYHKARDEKIDATILGIIYHPEIRAVLTDQGKSDIAKMIRTLAIAKLRCTCDNPVYKDGACQSCRFENENKDEYIKKLERRIHNQRVALRNNWMIVEERIRYRPTQLRSRWFDYAIKLAKEIRGSQNIS